MYMEQSIEERLQRFFSTYRLFSYRKGENIYRPGDDFEQVGFVKSGFVRCFSVTEDGKEVTMNSFKPIFYLSLYGALCTKDSRYYFEALTEVEVWKAPKDAVIELLKSDPELSLILLKNTLALLDEGLSDASKGFDSYKKVASLIYSMTREGNKEITDFKVPHRLIASLIGISRETASIQIKKLEREGYIAQSDGFLKIIDREKFRAQFSLE